MRDLPSRNISRTAAYYGLAIVTLLNLLNYVDRYILAAILPSVQAELRLTNAQAGYLATAFLITYFVTSPFFGALGDRISRTRLLAVGVGAWSMATAAGGLARNFIQMLMARAGVGVGEASYTTIAPVLLFDYFPGAQRGRAFAVFYAAIPIGAALGYLLAAVLEPAFGWRAAFYVVGLPGVALALLVLTAPDPPRGVSEEPNAITTVEPVRSALLGLYRNRAYVGTVLGSAAYTFGFGGLSFWMPTYLKEVRNVDLATANTIVGSVTVVAGVAGTFLGGYIGDRLSLHFKQGQLWLSGLSSVAAIVPSWLSLRAPSSSSTYIGWLFFAEFLLFLSTGPVNVVIVSVVPVGVRAMAMAVAIFTIHLLGDAIAPPIIGMLADARGLSHAVLIVPVAIAISGFIWTGTAAYFHSERS